MSKPEKKGRVPVLRFPEFWDKAEWEEEKLDDLFHFQDGFAFKSTDFVKSEKNVTQVIRITDINNKNSNEDKVYVPDSLLELNNLGRYIVNKGDLLLSLTGAAGFNFFFWGGRRAIINQRTAKITSKNETNYALAKLLEPLVHEKINARGEGQNNNLSKEFLSSIVLVIPEPAEQQKIANCLTSIDELITAQTQKLDALKIHKKGLMQQLFPRDGETVPKLRFPEFRDKGDWDADELGEIAEFVNEKVPLERVALENYVSTENILPDYGGVARASKLPAMGSVTRFRPHDTLVSNIRPYLKKVWVADKEGGASNDVIVIRAKQRLLPQYFSFLLRNDAFIDYVMTGAKGVKMPRGDIGSMKEYPALYPSKTEQQKIADCLTSIDELITAQTQKLDALKAHKKGLMQQLFPSVGGVAGEA